MTDEEIVGKYFLRDQSALSATAEKYGGFLRAVSVNILHNGSDAEECVSDTYLACWNTIPPENPRSLKAYAGTLCRNISFDCYKRARAETGRRPNGDAAFGDRGFSARGRKRGGL